MTPGEKQKSVDLFKMHRDARSKRNVGLQVYIAAYFKVETKLLWISLNCSVMPGEEETLTYYFKRQRDAR